MAANDVLQLAVLMAVFAAGLQSTPGGEDILQVCRRAILGLLIRAPADLPQDYVVLPKSDGVGNVAQPDAVRRAARTVDRTGHEMKCSEEIPAYSSVTTNNIQIFAQGFYKGRERGEHWWMYRIEFKNVGRQRVQLQARHWVFVDSNGKTVEVKGPGARGLTPKLGPDRRFQYESGTPLATSSGSMYGSFQFQVLRLEDGSRPETPIFFNARVGRLALTSDNTPAKVPCGAEAPEGQVPLTSVWASERIIIGVTTSHLRPEDEDDEDPVPLGAKKEHEKYRFLLDVQVNNGRDETVTIKQVHWVVRSDPAYLSDYQQQRAAALFEGKRRDGTGRVVESDGRLMQNANTRTHKAPGTEHVQQLVIVPAAADSSQEGGALAVRQAFTHVGVGNVPGQTHPFPAYQLTAGEAVRYQDLLAISAPSALAEGIMEVAIEVGDDEESDLDIEYKDMGGAQNAASYDASKPRTRTLQLPIARFALSVDEQAVPDLEPGAFF